MPVSQHICRYIDDDMIGVVNHVLPCLIFLIENDIADAAINAEALSASVSAWSLLPDDPPSRGHDFLMPDCELHIDGRAR